MNEIKKRRVPLPIKIVLVVVMLIILFMGGMFAKMQYEQSKMAPLETGAVIPGIYAVNNGFVNFFLLKGDAGYLMIDAGNDQNQTSQQLAQLGISPEEVSAILLTHSDADHTSSLPLFINAQIYLPEQEVQMINGTTSRSPMGGNKLDIAYQTLEDDEKISLMGFSVECIATPGHTPGSMSYLLDGKYMFVGDSMSLKDGKAALFNSFYNMDDEIQKSSMLTLSASSQPDYIFTAHYGYSEQPDVAFEDWRPYFCY